jgi:hypothetical protein
MAILKWISNLYAVKVRVRFIWFSTGLMPFSCEEANDSPGSINEGKFLDRLNDSASKDISDNVQQQYHL